MRTSEWVSKWFTRNGKTLGFNHKGIELFIKLDHGCHSLVRSLGTQLLNCERNIFQCYDNHSVEVHVFCMAIVTLTVIVIVSERVATNASTFKGGEIQ